MGESKEKLINAVKHYQDTLERHTKTGNVEKLLHAIEKLARLPIKVCHLEETGVGRTVNGLKKFEGSVGENARSLVDKWKNMVKGEEEEEERARLEKEQEMQEEEENDTSYEDKDPETLQIIEPEEVTTKENVKVISSSHRQSSSSNRQSHSSKHHKNSKRHRSSSDSDSSESNRQPKRHKSSKNYRKDSDSDSESSDSSRGRSSKNKHKSRKSSSESSGGDSSSDSQGDSSSDRVSAKHKSKSSRESKEKNKKSSSDSDRGKHKSKSRHQSQKDKSKSEKESSSKKKESRSKSRSESKHEKDKKSSSKSEDKKKESSRSHRENGKTSVEKKRNRESSADKELKRQNNESSDNQDSSLSKSRDKNIKKSEDSSRKDKDKINSSKKSSAKDKPKTSVSKIVDLDCIDSGSGTSFAAALGMLEAPVTSKPKKKIVEISQPSKSSSSDGTSSKSSSSKESSSKRSSSKESSSKSSRSKESSSKSSSSKESSSKSSSSKESPSKGSSSSSSKSHHKTSEVTKPKNLGIEEVDLFKNPTNLEPLPLDIDISNLLPQITPHYKPLGVSLDGFRRNLTDDEALSRVITAKHQRTKVYSGNKASYTKVPSLFDICCRILQDNIDALEYTGGVPYSILKPILEKANPDQLYQLEFHNPYLIEDTDELWQLHCQKEFRNKKKEEMESGREMYLRCLDEREAKLKALTANIKQSQDKSVPVRQTKLAYIDSVVKPPRNIARRQARNGTMLDSQRPAQTTQERLTQIAKAGEAGKVVVPKPGRPVSERSTSSHLKPKKAPLMAKTLSLLKNRFGRR